MTAAPPGCASSLLPSLPAGSRVLVIRLRSLGDIVLLTPSLRILKQWRPDLLLSVLIEERFSAALAGNPCVDEIIVLRRGKGVAKIAEQARLIRLLRTRRFALCVNLHGGPTSARFARLCGARWKAGFFHFRGQRTYDFSVPNPTALYQRETVHTAEHQSAPFFWLGAPRRAVPASEVFVAPKGHAEFEKWLSGAGLLAREYAVLHPTALFPTKQWPPERFARLGNYLEQRYHLPVIYSAGPGESACLDAIEEAAAASIRRMENMDLEAFIAALAGARLFVGNDSGPAHLAAALRRPLVVIFGSSNAGIWKPWRGSPGEGELAPPQPPFEVVQNAFECNPCAGDRCYRFDRPECILSVTFDQVRAAVDAALGASNGLAAP